MTRKKIIGFFDSHGALWVSCDASHPDAKAFGPTGSSFEAALVMKEFHSLLAEEGLTFWAFAKAHNFLVLAEDEFGFDLLVKPVLDRFLLDIE